MSVGESDEYYLSLPSNVSGANNTSSSWETLLPQTLHLHGNWEVGLAELIFVNSSDTIPDDLPFEIIFKNGVTRTMSLPAGNYDTPLAIIASMSREISRISASNKRAKRKVEQADDQDLGYALVTVPIDVAFQNTSALFEKPPEVKLLARLDDPVHTGVLTKVTDDSEKGVIPNVYPVVTVEAEKPLTAVSMNVERIDPAEIIVSEVQNATGQLTEQESGILTGVHPHVTVEEDKPFIPQRMEFKKDSNEAIVVSTAENMQDRYELAENDDELFDPLPIDKVLASGEYIILLSYDALKKRIKINVNDKLVEKFILSKGVAYLLGFDKEEITESCWSSYSPTPQIGSSTLYVFSDVASFSVLGDSTSNQLRIIPVIGPYGSVCDAVLNPIRYYPCRTGLVTSIQIDIRNEYGEKVRFNFGTTVAILHLRRKI